MNPAYNMKDYNKGINKANSLINKARKEKELKGYRENLGYDLYNNLSDYLDKLDLMYTEKQKVINYFIDLCDKL